MNIIMGLPRSGSTLLCNILAQNPAFDVRHTNMLPSMLGQLIRMWSHNPDVKGDLQRDREGTEDRIYRCAKAVCEEWHDRSEKIIFNKSRGWAGNLEVLKKLYPDAKIIVTVRDLREVFASFERQHQKNPLFDDSPDFVSKQMVVRAQRMFSHQGMIGAPLMGIEDILHRKQDVFWLKYEDFVRAPEEAMERIYCYIEQPTFEHDFEDVENTATDPDYLYLNKFPHKGEGKVAPRPSTWPKVMDEQISDAIVGGFPWFFREFKYIKPTKQQRKKKKKRA